MAGVGEDERGQDAHDCAAADRSHSPSEVNATITASIQYCERVASRAFSNSASARSCASARPATCPMTSAATCTYQTPVALQYDTGNYDATLDAALELSDRRNFEKRKAESLKNGKLRGIGYAAYIEACGIAPSAVAGSLGARAGLFEAGDALRNVVHDLKLPLFAVVGLRSYYAHQRGQGVDTCPVFTEPILKAWQIPYVLLDQKAGADDLARAYRQSQAEGRAGVALIAE